MNTYIYRCFLAIKKYKNITQAAESCFISQPTLSYHIKRIEKEMGFQIFHIDGHTVTPTEQGSVFLENLQRILQVEENMFAKIEEQKERELYKLRVCVDNHFRDPFIETVIPKYQKIFPKLNLSVIASNTEICLEMLLKQQIDIGIIPIRGKLPPGIECALISNSEYKFIYSPEETLDREYIQNHLSDYIKSKTFIFNRNYSYIADFQSEILTELKIIPTDRIFAPRMVDIARLVNQDAGISCLPEYMIKIVEDELQSLSFDPPWFFQHLLVWNESSNMKQYHQDLLPILKEMFNF